MSPPSRRELLRASGVGLAALAGCTARDDSLDDAATRTTTRRTETTAQRTSETTTTTEQTTTAAEASECAPKSLPETGWPLPDRDPANTNYAPSATGPVEKPSARWQRTAEPPETDAYVEAGFTDPAVTSDRLFVGKRLLPGAESPMPEGNALHAYDRASGERVWTYPLGDEAPRALAVTGDAVHVATWSRLSAVGRTDGTRRWTFDPEEGVEAVTPTDERIYVTAGSGSVTALRSDGTAEWTASAGERLSARPAVYDGSVFVGTADGTLTALRASDGRERWSATLAGGDSDSDRLVTDVAVTDCRILAIASDDVVALDPDGLVRWRATGGYGTVSTDGASVYAGTDDGHLRTFSAAGGAVEWETFLGDRNHRRVDGIWTDPVVADGTVYVSARPDSLYSFEARTGRENWKLTFDSLAHSGKPVVADDDLFVSAGNVLAAFA
ncbi:PQQ-like beta-propeller repeat protein [Halorussus limi]|uniref:PQQ-like beta-propeller repeat protein n=1 Tax=Halorussus limi TaxID=2938695 RepID=A0A8U0HT33_9EURY|nr:PQQ-binding-like beta-propeller repeat protein [Halorussus limi]UPV74150.1 PQQ-like beta-propeller repeat protein [Halorussus limi]